MFMRNEKQHDKGIHLVQVSLDDALLTETVYSEPIQRQLSYGREIADQWKGSHITILILTTKTGYKPYCIENVTFIPVRSGKFRRFLVLKYLYQLNNTDPIHIVTTQNVWNEAWAALFFCKWYKIPVIGQIHFDLLSKKGAESFGKGVINHFKYSITLKCLRYFNGIRVVGQRLAENLIRLNLQRKDGIQVLPVMVSFLQQEIKQTTRNSGKKHVLFVGRLAPEKNLEDWLRVAEKVLSKNREVIFDIVGDGDLRQALEKQAQHLGILSDIRFHGFIPNNKLSSIYSESDVFLLTSHYEGFGRVLVEAYAHKVPAVAVKMCGVEDIIQDKETGFLHKPGDIDGMAASVSNLLNDKDLAKKFGSKGERYVRQQFDPAKLTKGWIAMLLSYFPLSKPQILMPRRRTYDRYRKICHSMPFSILRSLEYEAITGLQLNGRTLDLGGGQENSYYNLLEINGIIDSVNINPKIKPTIIADLNQPMPIESECYDNIICFNTLEHLYSDRLAIQEGLRVLKPGGKFHFITPFLYRIHGSPYDFNRRTAEWWVETLTTFGIREDQFFVEPLVWDAMTTAFSLSPVSIFQWLQKVIMLRAVIKDFRMKQFRLPPTPVNAIVNSFVLGYYVYGTK